MKPLFQTRTLLVSLTALTVPTAALASSPQATTPPLPGWTTAQLSSATYVILEPKVEGNANVVSADQRRDILAAMKRDSAGALLRRYPKAIIATDAATPGAIRVTPVFVAPNTLVPWAKLGGRLEFEWPSGQKAILKEDFGISILLQHRGMFVNYMYDQLAKRMP